MKFKNGILNSSSPKLLKVVALLFSAFLLFGGAWFFIVRKTIAESADRAADAERVISGLPMAYDFQGGQELVYAVRYSNETRSSMAALLEKGASGGVGAGEQGQGSAFTSTDDDPNAQVVRTRIEGNLHFVTQSVDSETANADQTASTTDTTNTISVLVFFDNPQAFVAHNSTQTEAYDAALSQALTQPYELTLRPNGAVHGIRAAPGSSALAVGLVKNILGLVQVVLPPQGGQPIVPRYVIEEEDSTGLATTNYEVNADAGLVNMVQLIKTKNEIYKTATTNTQQGASQGSAQRASGGMQLSLQPRSRFLIEFNVAERMVSSLEGQEDVRVSASGKNVAHTLTNVNFNLVSAQLADAQRLSELQTNAKKAFASVSVAGLSSVQSSTPEELKNVQVQLLGNETVDSLWAQMGALEGREEGTGARARKIEELATKVKAMLQLRPQDAAALAQKMQNLDPQSEAMRMLVGALAEGGSLQAQDALLDVLEGRASSPQVALLVLPMLGNLNTPTPRTQDVLIDLSRSPDRNIATTAQLALGAVAQAVASQDPARADSIAQTFQKKLEAAKSEGNSDSVKDALAALGNTGSASAFSAVAKFVDNANSDVRTEAVMALRHMKSAEAEGLLLKTLQNDSDVNVRVEAARALGYHELTPQSFAAQREVLLNSTDARVRQVLLAELWRARDAYPEVIELVRLSATGSSDESMRQLAQNLLKSL